MAGFCTALGTHRAFVLITRIAGALIVTCTILIMSSLLVAYGPIQRFGSAYSVGFQGCTLPCWAEIEVEHTLLQEVPVLLEHYVASIAPDTPISTGSFLAFGRSGELSGIIWPVGTFVGYISLSGINVPAWLLLADLDTPTCVQYLPPDALVLIWEHPDATVTATFLGNSADSWNIERTASMLYIGSASERPCTEHLYDRLMPWHGMVPPIRYSQ